MAVDLKRLRSLVGEATRRGARAAEVYALQSEGVQLGVSRGKATFRQPTREDVLTVRVWGEAGRTGEARGSSDSAESLIDRALNAAAKAEPDGLAGPVERFRIEPAGLGIDDRRHPQLDEAARIDVPAMAERSVRQEDRRVIPGPFGYEDRRTHRVYASSRDHVLEEWGTTYRAWGSVRIEDDVGNWTLEDGVHSRAYASIACLPFGIMLARRAAGLLRPVAPPEGPVRVLMPAHVVAPVIARLAELFTPEHVDGRDTFLTRTPDRRAVDPRLHLLDDGGAAGGLLTRAFDDRGVPPVPLTLLREGWVGGCYLDPERARARGVRPTGHDVEGALRPSNLSLRSGTRSTNVILGEQKDPVLVIEELRGLETLDVATGQVELRISGRFHKGTTAGAAVRGARLTGDLGRVLGELADVTSDTDRIGTVDTPGLLMDGFSLSAG